MAHNQEHDQNHDPTTHNSKKTRKLGFESSVKMLRGLQLLPCHPISMVLDPPNEPSRLSSLRRYCMLSAHVGEGPAGLSGNSN